MIERIEDQLSNLCQEIREHKNIIETVDCNETFFVSVKEGAIFINSVEIINSRAKLQYEIFKILIEHYINEFFCSTTKYLSILQINSSLKEIGILLDDPENQIRTAIYKIRKTVRHLIGENMNNDIIDSLKWHGYKINEKVCFKR